MTKMRGVNIDRHWSHIKEAVNTTCEEVLGRRKPQQKDWISAETIRKIQIRKDKKGAEHSSRTRAAKATAKKEHTAANREVRKSVKTDKRDFVEGLAEEAERAAASRNMKQLYDTTRKLAGKFKKSERPIRDKNGTVLIGLDKQLSRWAEHFGELLNRPRPHNQPDIQPAEEDLLINCDKPTRGEIKHAIGHIQNGKAAGPDGIPPEALKGDVTTSVEMLYSLFEEIWEKEEIPAEWKEGYLIKIPKKGDLSRCDNFRGITLLSVPGKVLNRIILERMKDEVDKTLREEQAGFRQDRSCTDQIATLRIIVEQSIEWNSSLYVNFVDYEKAFDSLDRETLIKLRHYRVPMKLVNMIKNSFEGMSCRVIHDGQLTKN